MATDAYTEPDVVHVESWVGETRVNLLRLCFLLLFYGHHLVQFYGLKSGALSSPFHAQATALVLVWGGLIAVLYLCLDLRRCHPWVKYATSLSDTILITIMICLAGGPRSPLVLLYPLVIVSAPLRLSLRLVYVVTLSTMLAYMTCVGFYAWYQIGWDRYYADTQLRIPRSDQFIVLLVLFSAGLIAGQALRQTRRLLATSQADAQAGETTA